MAPGARSEFGALMFELEVLRKQMYCIEESTCDIVGTFRRPLQSFGARGTGTYIYSFNDDERQAGA